MKKIISSRQSERGQSLTEFAISMIILLILVAGVFDGSRALFTYLSMRDAAQEGALYASIDPTDQSEIIDRVCAASNMITEMCNTEGVANLGDGSEFDIAIEYIPGDQCMSRSGPSNGVRVTVSHDAFPLTMPFIGAMIGRNDVEITASILDSIITPACP